MPCAAWTSSSSRRRGPMRRRRPSCVASRCRSSTDRPKEASPHGEEKLGAQEPPACAAGEAHGVEAGAAQGDRRRSLAAARGAVRGAAQAGRAAAQFIGDARPQPLRADRAPARLLPQIQALAHRAARTRLGRPDSRHGQVELVRETERMSMTDPLGDMLTRIRNAQQAYKTVIQSASSKIHTNVLEVLQREGYIRGYQREEIRQGAP